MERLQIGHHGPGVTLAHSKRHHGKSERLAIGPNSGRQQLHHIRIARGGISTNPWSIDRPVWICIRRPQGYRSAVKRSNRIKCSTGVPGRVTLPAHCHVFDEILSSRNFRGSASIGSRYFRILLCPCTGRHHQHRQTPIDQNRRPARSALLLSEWGGRHNSKHKLKDIGENRCRRIRRIV